MLLQYKSELDGRIVEVVWSDNLNLFEEEVRIAFGGELYSHGDGWISISNVNSEEVFILQ